MFKKKSKYQIVGVGLFIHVVKAIIYEYIQMFPLHDWSKHVEILDSDTQTISYAMAYVHVWAAFILNCVRKIHGSCVRDGISL